MDIMELLRVVHLIGMAFGVGAGIVADSLMGQAVFTNKIGENQVKMMHQVGAIVTGGLTLLIASGVCFLIYYNTYSPELLTNPKLWAKLGVVAVIALNGFVLHQVILPFLDSRKNKPLFTPQNKVKAHVTMTVGAISVTSWYTALILGSWAGLNFDFSFATIFGVYLVILILAITFANLSAWFLARQHVKTAS